MIKKDNICIIAVGYNRPDSLNKLLKSLGNADYGKEVVDLIISIDKSNNQDTVIKVADSFRWAQGEKKIRTFTERQGLKSHIIQCGDLSNQYDAVIVLEDDVTVAPDFFYFTKKALEFYGNDEYVAGISLYKHVMNVGIYHFFEPDFNGYDTFFMQIAQSWGQCWNARMWNGFKKWYLNNRNLFKLKTNNKLLSNIPENIKTWGEQSWLKFYMAYIIEKNLFFVYPYYSFSTNHSEVGEHNNYASSDYQVMLASGKKEFNFCKFEDAIKYDAFFERLDYRIPGYEDKKIILDLYGAKNTIIGADILISSKQLPYKVIESWALRYHPHELNCKYQEKGIGLYVYDLKQKDRKPKYNTELIRTRFDVRSTSWKLLLKLGLVGLKNACMIRLRS